MTKKDIMGKVYHKLNLRMQSEDVVVDDDESKVEVKSNEIEQMV
jgi:hypothetical protein